jgi:hypothetical protein
MARLARVVAVGVPHHGAGTHGPNTYVSNLYGYRNVVNIPSLHGVARELRLFHGDKHFQDRSVALRIPPLRSPGFPIELDSVDTLHAPFFTEMRTRGLVQCCVAGNPGTLRSG